MRGSDRLRLATLRKRDAMQSSLWTVLYTYGLRIACFVCTIEGAVWAVTHLHKTASHQAWTTDGLPPSATVRHISIVPLHS